MRSGLRCGIGFDSAPIMKICFKSALLAFFLIIIDFTLEAQTFNSLKYEIGTKLFSLGTYELNQKKSGDSVIYFSESQVVVPYLFSDYKVTFKSETHFLRDTLRFCKVKVWVNDEVREWNITEYRGGAYKVIRKKEDEKPQTSTLSVPAIKVTSSSLFFEEPKGVSHNYAELFGYFNKIESTGKSSYLLTDKETGRTTEYIYKKGQIWETKIDYPIMTFGLTRIKPKGKNQ
jgi:hypothetical protein